MMTRSIAPIGLLLAALAVALTLPFARTDAQMAPSCSVTVTPNVVDPGEPATVSWTSSGATLFYINNIGYVGESGSVQVSRNATTDYSGSVTGGEDGEAMSTYIVEALPKRGGFTAGQCFSGGQTRTINTATKYITLDGTYGYPNNGLGSPEKAVCVISQQGGSLREAVYTLRNAAGDVVYQSPTQLDCGEYVGEIARWGLGADLYNWSDAPRRVDLDPASAPYTLTASGYGCNGYSSDFLVVWAGTQVTEYGANVAQCPATLTVTGDGAGGNGGNCTSTGLRCGADGNLSDNCGTVVSCQFGCSAQTNGCYSSCQPRNACDASGTRVVNSCSGAVIENCTDRGEGWLCQSGACVPPGPPSFEEFDAADGTRMSGHLTARPTLVGPNRTTALFWNVTNAASCDVTGTNDDVWSGLFSGLSGVQSRGIVGQVIYTLSCTALPGASPASIVESVTVRTVPVFQEL